MENHKNSIDIAHDLAILYLKSKLDIKDINKDELSIFRAYKSAYDNFIGYLKNGE